MGGGAPLAFLSKKGWHPSRPQNLEEVWKREQAAAAEAKKVEELRKAYDDERKKDEFVQMAHEAGHLKKDQRLDWMYGGGMAAQQGANARQDATAATAAGATAAAAAPLMGRQPAPNEDLSRAERASLLPSFMATDTPASQNEQWQRLNADPLLAIKRQEAESLKRIKDNPVRMQEILQEVRKLKESKSKHKKDKKEKKAHKKAHKREHQARRGGSSSSSEDEARGGVHKRRRSESPLPLERGRAVGGGRNGMQQQQQQQHDPQHDRQQQQQPHRRSRSRSPLGRSRGEAPANGHRTGQGSGFRRQRSASPVPRSPKRAHTDGYDRPAHGAGRQRGGGVGGERLERPSHGHHRDDEERDHRHGSERGQGQNDRSRAHANRDRVGADRDRAGADRDRAGADRRHAHDAAGDRHEGGHGRQHDAQHKQPDERRTGSSHHDAQQDDIHRPRDAADSVGGGSIRDGRSGYGLQVHGHMHLREEQLAARAADTRARLEEGAKKREAEEAEKARQRHQKREYRPGKLTEEERAAKLAEMMGNAQQHERSRAERLATAAERDAAATAAAAVGAGGGDAASKAAATREVFGAMTGGGASLEARIGSRKYYSQRG